MNEQQQLNRLEEVKKLIFGDEINTYNTEIDGLKAKLENYKTEVSVKIDDVKIELLKSIESAEKRLLDVINKFQQAASQEIQTQKENHVSKASLSDVFENISKGLSK